VDRLPAGDNRGIAFLFGLLGALLLVIAGVVAFVGGFVSLAVGSGSHALGDWGRSVLYVVIGMVIGFFAALGHSGNRDRTFASGLILVVLAIVGWVGLGFVGALLALIGALFALIAGILYLVSGR
jgi:hypothetical protein